MCMDTSTNIPHWWKIRIQSEGGPSASPIWAECDAAGGQTGSGTEDWDLGRFFFLVFFSCGLPLHTMASKNQQTSGYFKPPESREVFAVSSRRRSGSTRSRAEFYVQTLRDGICRSSDRDVEKKKKVLSGSAVIQIFLRTLQTQWAEKIYRENNLTLYRIKKKKKKTSPALTGS